MAMATVSNDAELLLFTNYESTLHKSFVDMFRKEELTDATLICDSKRVRIHKFLLSASSSFFNNVFKKHGGDCNISIKNVAYDDLIKVLEYIYNGEAALHPTKVNAFIDAANKFSVTISGDKIQKVSAHLGSTHNEIKLDTLKWNVQCDNAVAAIESDCTDRNVIGLGKAETIHINMHKLANERDRAQKKTNKSDKFGIVVVSQMEFLERMFKLRNLPWPMDCDQTTQKVAQQSNVKARSSKEISETFRPSPGPSTSKPKLVDTPQLAVEHDAESVTENKSVDSEVRNSVHKIRTQINTLKRAIRRGNKRDGIKPDVIVQKEQKLNKLKQQFENMTATQSEESPESKSKPKNPDWKKTRKEKRMMKIAQENGVNMATKRIRSRKRTNNTSKSKECAPSNSKNNE
ncbi:uncharacterized protein LOC129577168 [Sitodiplosis mosellana]|uniref:uncharacterized protein LOC129577168 n=1 Tax=Sitodiplosis mosellana TaxID=263140 RepID=UPI002444F1DD|nr:uncharacterized protein LOC129577168 [Sitodiplosis mosellana]